MRIPTVAVLAGALVIMASCDLPTTVDEARDRLGQNQEERIVPVHLPMPELSVTLADQMAALSEIVDTTDLSFRVDPDTFAFSLDSLLTIDPVDPAAVTQGYDIVIDDFTQDITVTLPAVPIQLPGDSVQLPLAPITPAGSQAIGVDLSGSFNDVTFAAGSELQVILTTDAASTVDSVDASVVNSLGDTLASAPGTVTLAQGSTDSLSIPLGGVALPATFDLVLSYAGGSGDAGGDELTVKFEFANAEAVAATGVDAASVSDVNFSESVALDQSGDNFSQATLAEGTVSVDTFVSGTLGFTPGFDGDLSGLTVGASSPDSLTVAGTVGAPDGATTVDVENTANITVLFSGLAVESVTLDSVSMDVNQTVAIAGTDSTLNDLQELTIESGSLQLDVANRLGVGGTVMLTLNGAVDASGNTITQEITVAASPDGTAEVTTATVDLAGAVLTPANFDPEVAGTISGTDVTVTPDAAADAVTVDPFLSIQAREVVLSGVPDLEVALDERVNITSSEIALEDLSDLLGSIDFNDVTFSVSLDNATGLDLQVDGFRMTLLDSTDVPVVTGSDTARVELSNDTSGLVLMPANSVTTVSDSAHAFVNQLLDEIAAGRDVTVAAGGVAGPAADSGSVALGDNLTVVYDITLGPDITIDPDGIQFDQVVAEALDLDSIASEFLADLSEDLVSAEVEFEAINGLPLGMAVSMVLAPTPTNPADTVDWDPFAEDSVITLPEFSFGAAEVDSATGKASTPTTDTTTATVQPSEFTVLEKGLLGMGLQATINGPTGGRAVLQPTDSLVLRPLLKIEIRVGGSSGGGQ